MAGLSHYMTEQVLDGIFNGGTITPPTEMWFALYNTNPAAANTGTEVSGGGYARVQITDMTAADLVSAKMTVANSADVQMAAASGNWTTANYWAILDAETGGNLWVFAPLLAAANVTVGQQPLFAAGDLKITLE